MVDAVRHAQAAQDWRFATRLLADHSFSLSLNGQGATVGALLAAFPADALSDPELAAVFASCKLAGGSLDDAAAYIALAERNASAVRGEPRRRLDVTLAVARLLLARRRGDFGSVLDEVKSLLGPTDAQTLTDVALGNDVRAVALMNLGIVELWSFRFEEAARDLEKGLELARRIGRPYVEIGCLGHLALLAGLRSFDLSRERCDEAIAIAEAQGWASEPIAWVALALRCGDDVWRGSFEEAEHWLARAERALRPDVEPATGLVLHLARGMVHAGRNQFERALAEFRAAEQLQTLLVAPHAARACVHLADGDPQAALDALTAVLDGSASVVHISSVIQALLLGAIARERLGQTQAAESDIERALELAEPDGIVFPFVMTPPHDLLERHPPHRTAHAPLLQDILDVLAGSSLPARADEPQQLRENLSEGELRVLRFLPTNLSAPEIGNELYLSVNTVKTHMRHIYAKLGVHRRTEAVERARELGLLRPSSRHR
ncbi:LuxR C-terminal-related transcriptional regulator [Streptomyces europaeiscabiei]|uniref:LuxR C-terminal-related transcriptional regulator n=1 Tax=Streptomyces europaeiscabiei TaxID=146819 RepID=A0AAJ2PKX7_9ACTN|nr:LuxR C-terminal-related transcriptional regulator [Streptomyces europaeiscabiei]MDX3129378.1 LuxR C-terminal-related transcriptional regulator [Streptomyces europaeiscabiei]